ncbi:MAG: response regulator [Deltaproteobacteria bacterium]|nr:MAG: response regulator [Deltaproteobacteria bacterium]
MRILIVDDDAMVVRSCRRILELEGVEIQSADNVEDGLTILTAGEVDLMLTDIKMPGQDGFELIKQARKIQPELPILMMTGYLTAETIEAGQRAGADNCIAKPFTPDELIQAVRQIR